MAAQLVVERHVVDARVVGAVARVRVLEATANDHVQEAVEDVGVEHVRGHEAEEAARALRHAVLVVELEREVGDEPAPGRPRRARREARRPCPRAWCGQQGDDAEVRFSASMSMPSRLSPPPSS